jgi:hypothetical protein
MLSAMKLKPYQKRVVQEKKELDTKLKKLNEFMLAPGGVEPVELELLKRQLEAMTRYQTVLGERIARYR